MDFTNSLYERMMKEIPHYAKSAPQKVPEGSVRGVLIGRVSPVFSVIESTSKSKVDMLAFVPK